MAEPVDNDARGVVNPAAGLRHFSLDRHDPSPRLARFVELFWIVQWDLPAGATFTQEIVTHPSVNLAVERWSDRAAIAEVHGVVTHRDERTLSGDGCVLGVKFRPGGFRPFLDRSVRSITNRSLPVTVLLGPEVVRIGHQLSAGAAPDDLVADLDRALSDLSPEGHVQSEDVTALAEAVIADRSITRVDAVAARAGVGVRHLERRFRDAVGVNPKWVIRRARLHEAAERVRSGEPVDWSVVAVELGFSDQSHLTREFSAAYGRSPARYATECGMAVQRADDDVDCGVDGAVAAVGGAESARR